MSLYIDVLCTPTHFLPEDGGENLSIEDRREKTVKVIGEILPYVLARYGVSVPTESPDSLRSQARLQTGSGVQYRSTSGAHPSGVSRYEDGCSRFRTA